MKTLLTLLLSLSSFFAGAQKFMLGVQGGVMLNTAPSGSSEYFTNFESTPQMVVAGKLGIDTRKLQAGIGCLASSISQTRELKVSGYTGSTPQFTYDYSASQVTPYVFLNIKKNLVRSFLYFGVNAGYIIYGSSKDEAYYLGKYFDNINTAHEGFAGGLQAGARIKLIDGLGISAEAGMRYASASGALLIHDTMGNDYGVLNRNGIFSFPITLGIDYIF